MATRISPPQNKTYYINPAYLTFVENSGYGANLIQVSASSLCYISVYDPSNGIGYSDADRNYRRWKVAAYNNKFPDDKPEQRGEWHIYVRLERNGTSALVVYDQVLRGVKGGEVTVSKDESGNDVYTEDEPTQDTYWFIRIGDVGATDGTSIRSITYDTGYLTSDEGRDTAELNEMWELDKYSTPWLIRAKRWLHGFTVKGLVKFIGGLVFSRNVDGPEKLVSDIKRSMDDAPEYILNEDGTLKMDADGNPVRNPDFVPVSDETLATSKYVEQSIGKMEDKFLRKDKPDETEYRIIFKDGIEVGEYVKGLIGGSGTKLDGDGYGEMNGLTLREFLEVPELRFNRVDVVSGELWNSVAFGLVEDVDTENRICSLKLEPGERAGLRPLDICRGIFADFGGGESYEETDECGFMHLYGFYTSYFSVVNILEDSDGVCRFTYSLRTDDTPHPCKSMKFAVYGNFDDRYPERQASAYSTRTYKRYLNKVNTWVIDPDRNIYAQYGDLSGLKISGLEMNGYGSYQSNSYLKGVQIQLSDEQKEELKGEDAYSVVLSDYVGVVRMDGDGNIVGGEYAPMNVVTGDENVVTGDENVVTGDYLLQTRIQAFRGKTELFYSESPSEGNYMAIASGVGCSVEISGGIVSVLDISDTSHCYVRINVNCEGYASYTLTYQIKVVKDGSPSITADLDNEMDSISCTSDGKVLFGLPVSTNVSMWSGLRQLEIDGVTVSAPEGVVAKGTLSDSSGKATVTVESVGDSVGAVIPVGISVYAVIEGTRYRKDLVFTINKILQGEGAVIYKLRPSASAVKVDDAGVMTTNIVRCYVTEHDGSGVRVLDALPEGVLALLPVELKVC